MRYFLDIITERRPSSVLLKGLLSALSYLFRAGVALRHLAYAHRWMPSTKLKTPVISVGNVVVGGTGKTPFVQMLTRALEQRGKVAILTRGFKSQFERSKEIVKVAKEGRVLYSADRCGDEPFYLGQETLADVWVACDRVEAGRRAIRDGAECLILDDGMQHRRLAREVEIVIVDGKDPIAQGRFLPRGLLRDFPSRLQEAHLVVVNHICDAAQWTAAQEILRPLTSAPLLAVHPVLDVEQLKNKRVGVFCGIGRPERFIDGLRALGVDVVDALILLDHQAPSEQQLQHFAKQCLQKGAQSLVCTVKDAVKLIPIPGLQCDLPICPVKMRLSIFSGKEHWDALIHKIEESMIESRNRP